MYFDPYRGYIVEDRSEPSETRHSYNLMDLEDGGDGRSSCAISLPPTMETKLIREATHEEEAINARMHAALDVKVPT